MPGTLFSVVERVLKFDLVISSKAQSSKCYSFCFPECGIAILIVLISLLTLQCSCAVLFKNRNL